MEHTSSLLRLPPKRDQAPKNALSAGQLFYDDFEPAFVHHGHKFEICYRNLKLFPSAVSVPTFPFISLLDSLREVARLFEGAGVARTERSITNWCQPNKMGVARLENYFDPNERKYFISPKSVEQVIQEEIAKAAKSGDSGASTENVPKDSEPEKRQIREASEGELERIRELQKEILDLKITNRGKDFFIEQLQKEREGFAQERQGYVEKLMNFNRKLGELETKLLQVEGPRGTAN